MPRPSRMVGDSHKSCKDCGEVLPLEAFSLYRPRNGRAAVYAPRCLSCARQKTALWRRELKDQVLAAYGGACRCCGESHEAFLALDHVAGGGRQHRREVGGGNMSVYRDARDRGFPPDFQLLCHNCNVAKHLLGECPHQSSQVGPTLDGRSNF